MSFGIYMTGFVLVIAGLLYGASLMHVPTHWIVAGGIVLVGVGILMGVKVTRQKDSAN
jgi:cadmium resistance protein CadD (predicted permease)